MPTTALDARLCEAIYTQQLPQVLDGLAADPAANDPENARQIAAARAALAAVQQQNSALHAEMSAAFTQAGIVPLASTGDGANPHPQYQKLVYRLAPPDLPRALRIAAGCGFVLATAISPGAAHAMRRWSNKIDLVRAEGAHTRLSFEWQPSVSAGRWPKRLRPGLDDYLYADLPGGLWPLYGLVRLPRKVRERLIGAARRKPALQIASLGTPASLVAPLARFAGITERDRLVDVGCGDASLLIEMVRLTGCRAIGIEMDAWCSDQAVAAVRRAGLEDRISIIAGRAEPRHIAEGSCVFTFQPPGAPLRAVLKLVLPNLAPGSRFLTHEQVALPDCPPPDCPPPDRSAPLFGADAITVAHLWTAQS